jgi:hypothetical protein
MSVGYFFISGTKCLYHQRQRIELDQLTPKTSLLTDGYEPSWKIEITINIL